MPYQRLSVIGAGSWGLALASVAHRAGRDVMVWARSRDTAEVRSAQGSGAASHGGGIFSRLRETFTGR